MFDEEDIFSTCQTKVIFPFGLIFFRRKDNVRKVSKNMFGLQTEEWASNLRET